MILKVHKNKGTSNLNDMSLKFRPRRRWQQQHTYAHNRYKMSDDSWSMMSEGHPFEDDVNQRVGVILHDKARYTLLVQGGTRKWSLPKGCRKRGETEWEGAMREAWEETGLDLEAEEGKRVKYVKTWHLDHGLYYEFELLVPRDEIRAAPAKGFNGRDAKATDWMQIDGYPIRKQPCNQDLRCYIKRIKNLKHLQPKLFL